jgi:hypothetical protein
MDVFDILQMVFRQEVVEMLETRVATTPQELGTPEVEFYSFLFVNLVRLNALLHFHNRENQLGRIVANDNDYKVAFNLMPHLMARNLQS